MRQVGYSWIAVGTEPMRAPPPYHDAAFGGRTDATACELASKPGGGPKSRAVAAAAVGGPPPLPAWACDAPREGGKENEAERCCSRHKHAAEDSENTPTKQPLSAPPRTGGSSSPKGHDDDAALPAAVALPLGGSLTPVAASRGGWTPDVATASAPPKAGNSEYAARVAAVVPPCTRPNPVADADRRTAASAAAPNSACGDTDFHWRCVGGSSPLDAPPPAAAGAGGTTGATAPTVGPVKLQL